MSPSCRSERWRKGLSSNNPLLSSSSTALSINSSSPTTLNPTAPTRPTANSSPARNRKYRNTSTSPFLKSSFCAKKWLPTWLCHIPLSPNAAIGIASANPLCFPLPKFFAQVVTALRYMQLVPIPTPTKATTIVANGHPPSLFGGPPWYANAASR